MRHVVLFVRLLLFILGSGSTCQPLEIDLEYIPLPAAADDGVQPVNNQHDLFTGIIADDANPSNVASISVSNSKTFINRSPIVETKDGGGLTFQRHRVHNQEEGSKADVSLCDLEAPD